MSKANPTNTTCKARHPTLAFVNTIRFMTLRYCMNVVLNAVPNLGSFANHGIQEVYCTKGLHSPLGSA